MSKRGHWSDCAVHNEPALPAGECDCGGLDDFPEKWWAWRAEEEARQPIAMNSRMLSMPLQPDEKTVEQVARAIAVRGFGRPWDDFKELSAFDTDQADLREYAEAAIEAITKALASSSVPEPIPMLLHCPKCGLQHIDEPDERTPEWDNPPHRSHLCHGCGCIWRPADVATNGVAAIETVGKADTWAPQDRGASQEDGRA